MRVTAPRNGAEMSARAPLPVTPRSAGQGTASARRAAMVAAAVAGL